MKNSVIRKERLALFSFVFVYLYTLLYLIPFTEAYIDSFFALLYLSLLCLGILYFQKSWKEEMPITALKMYHLLLLGSLVTIIRGFYIVSGYLDWKRLLVAGNGALSFLIPLAVVAGVNFQFSRRILRFFITSLKLSFILIPIALTGANEVYGRGAVCVVLLILFIPYLKQKDWVLVLVVAVLALILGLTFRTNLLRIAFSFSFLGLYYFRKSIFLNLSIRIGLLVLFFVPAYFLYLGIQGDSIFERESESEKYVVTDSEGEQNLFADTRTFLYQEVLGDLYNSGNLIFGRGAGARYKSDVFDDITYKEGRDNVEVGLLEILLYSGLIGLLLYGIVFAYAIFYGIWRTNNSLTKMLAMFLAAHWFILFLENRTVYDQYSFLIWFIVGLCFSKSLRSLTDEQIKDWIYNRESVISTS